MIERIVENWLTSASERGYQIAFCQLLATEGEELLYIAKHGPFEKGKDVITRAPDDSIRAYQLKAGDVRLADWREIDAQINNLVELPVNLPNCPPNSFHTPYFVTNGRIDDVVLDYINTANISWQLRKFPYPLGVIAQPQMVHRFLAVHGSYLPQEAKDFKLFLTLLLNDGAAPLDKMAFTQFLESVISFADSTTERNASRSVSSAVLLTSYILGPAEKCSNHWSVFEAWTVMASYILAVATKFSLQQKLWEPSFNLAMFGANRALDDIVEEAKGRAHYTEGDPMADGFFYGSRQTILAGLLSAWALRRRREGLEADKQIQKLINSRIRESFIWGESAAPFILMAALELEQQCQQLAAEGLVLNYLQVLLFCHAEGNRGLPDSFTTPEDSIKFMHRIGEQDVESFQGFSYTCHIVIEYLARRWRRRALSSTWEAITRLSLDSSIPQVLWEWFFWRAESAVLQSDIPAQPQSWSTLVQNASARDISALPPLLTKQPVFAMFFLLVFPHRLTSATFAMLDRPL